MKKPIVLSLVLLSISLLNYSVASDGHWPLSVEKLAGVNTLIVNANVTIVLVNNNSPVLEMVGNKSLSKNVSFEKTGNTLVISVANKKNLVGAGVIYISANEFRKIQINGNCNLRTLNTLQIPTLDVVFNGVCEFEIRNIGEVNIKESKDYILEQDKEVRKIPASVIENKPLRGF
jgi:Putative auto-transporter adhesin, head GIN domain